MSDKITKPEWYSIKEASEFLDIGEPTLYRWMKENQITYRKVGDSTRFLKEDLDAVMKVFPSEKDAGTIKKICPVCHHDDLVEGVVQSTGLNYFRPKKTKFWVFRDSNINTQAWMCIRCGGISWFGDSSKLKQLRMSVEPNEAASKSSE